MMTSLAREMRLEKELRRGFGAQFGIAAQRVRGTVQCPDYAARIPLALVKLYNLLKTRGGLDTVVVFRIQPDANEFPRVKAALNANDAQFHTADVELHCIANTIKVWFRDLPVKLLSAMPKSTLLKAHDEEAVAQLLDSELREQCIGGVVRHAVSISCFQVRQGKGRRKRGQQVQASRSRDQRGLTCVCLEIGTYTVRVCF